jgi:hypothetical protein
MVKHWQKKLAVTAILALSLPLFPGTVHAADASDSDPYVNGKLSPVRCLQKGNVDFGIFLRTLIWDDGLGDAFLEPFIDIFWRNQCHALDVLSLRKQENQIRKQIRDAFLTCNNQKVPRLREAYFKTLGEIHYARSIVDAKLAINLPLNLYGTRDFMDHPAVKNRDKMYEELFNAYVSDDKIPEENFDNYFFRLEGKYEERIQSYMVCDNGSWQEVKEKWEEFDKFWSEDLGDQVMSGFDEIASAAVEVADEAASMSSIELLQGKESFMGFLGSFVETSFNGLGVEDGAEEFWNTLKDELPFADLPSIDTGEYIGAIAGAGDLFEREKIRRELQQSFYGLYLETNDAGVKLIMNTLDGRKTPAKNDGLIEIIDASFSPLNQLLTGSKEILDRQCPAG